MVPLITPLVIIKREIFGVSIEGHRNNETYLEIQIINHSNSVSAVELKVSVCFLNPTRKWRIWKRKWITFYSETVNTLNTNGRYLICCAESIEGFLNKFDSNIIQKAVYIADSDEITYYSSKKLAALKVRIDISFSPGVMIAKNIEFIKKCKLSKEEIEIDGANMINWRVIA